MSKRNHHLTDLGCIACEELSELGAGREGWLDDPAILCAVDDHSVAVANKYVLLILDWSVLDEPRVKIRPDLSPIEAEHITAIEWLVLDDFRVVAVATSRGYLLIYSLSGDLIHRQMLYSGRVMKLRVRGLKEGVNQDASSGEVCAVMPGVIARVDAMDIQAMLERWFEETSSQFWDQKSKKRDPEESGCPYGRLPYQLWNVNKYGNIVDAGITGVMPPPLLELQSSQRYFRAVIIGDDAVISAYRLSEDKSRSLVGAIFSKVVPAAFSTIASFSKMIWRSEQTPSRKSDEKLQSFAKASPLTCLKDHPRKGEKLSLSPSGTLAAITDSLGRILLLDTQALVVVRLWKGYRDANCLFFEILANRETLGSSSSDYQKLKSDYRLCLAIHAPRKGIIEVWQMRTGPRLLTIQCAKGSRLLQPTYRLGSRMGPPYVPHEVLLLNGDSCQMSVLNRHLN